MKLSQANILIVDDDSDILTAVRLLLKPVVKNVITDLKPENLRQLLSKNDFDIILLDMNFNSAVNTGNEGLYWLRQIREWQVKADVIMITAYADIDLAVKCLKEGASDFIVKPWHNDNLLQTINNILSKKSNTSGKQVKTLNKPDFNIVGESDLMVDIFQKLEKVAPTDANILILGENGTGKDLIAQAIHNSSLRKNKPYIKVDVGALTDSLFESELFGHKKGAFTDAREDRIGLFEAANGGTIFLDEIGNISLQQQAKLLTVLQNRQVTRLGTNTPIPIDIRLITATNVPFSDLANESRFRKDLIYRINTVEITIPPLRERDNDIIRIALYFLKQYEEKYLKGTLTLSKETQQKLMQYDYPGNVRELQYTIERAVIMSDSNTLYPKDIVFSPIERKQESTTGNNLNLEDIEKNTIIKAVERHQGNISKAAKELGLTRAALYRRLDKYDI
jgi:DNA-binding NtrC family response regulator